MRNLLPLRCSAPPRKTVTFNRLQTSPAAAVIRPPRRSLAQVRSDREIFPELWWTSSKPPLLARVDGGPHAKDVNPPDERTLKLGQSRN